MKNFNNYLYITDESIQELIEFNESRLKFKYGKGSSENYFKNNRTERRLNLNKPHPSYEKTYFCETQKEYTYKEIYVLNKLNNDNRFTNIKTDTITKKKSEFFWIKEKCKSKKHLLKIWYDLSNLIESYHYEYNLLYIESGDINENIINQKENIEEEDINNEDINDEEKNKKIKFDEINEKTMTVTGSTINGKFDNRIIKSWNSLYFILVDYIYTKICNYNLEELNKIVKSTVYDNNSDNLSKKKVFDNNIYMYNVDAETSFKYAKYFKKLYNFNYDDIIIELD